MATALLKVRPETAAPAATSASLSAARNELEPFQIVIEGGDGGVGGVTAAVSDLVGPGESRIPASQLTLYRVGLYQVTTPSNTEGAPGEWPDPLIPDVDLYAGEKRNAFPFDVPPGESRAIWVDLLVPVDAPAGMYSGAVTVSGTGLGDVVVPVSLRVRSFTLPSTPTLKSAFGMGWNDACPAHLGSSSACDVEDFEAFNVLYARAALDHRISIESVVRDGPHDGDFTSFDARYGPLLDGDADTRLAGARQTTLRVKTGDPVELAQWREHFDGRGWGDVLFDYTCDEPPAGCGFDEIADLAAGPRAAGIRTLVTIDIDELVAYDLAGVVDIATPVVNYMHDKDGDDRRSDYDAFLTASDDKELWWYQSCLSHGCGGGCQTTTNDYYTGWPSMMIDVSPVQNRAMEWLSFLYRIEGELYFQTTHALDTAWEPDGACDYSGHGDGTLFYPGRPDRIGGTTHIPVKSIRLKLIREGVEDFEYLSMLASLGDRELAEAEARALFPAPYAASQADPDDLYAARARIADRIEELVGAPGRPRAVASRAEGAVTIDGDLAEYGGAERVEVGAGAARASFRLIWDDEALYVGATVEDPALWVRGSGPDGELWDADGVELMIDGDFDRSMDPDDDDRHLIVTAAGDVLDANGCGTNEDRTATFGVERVVVADGTIGDGLPDGGYVVEVRVPWSALGVTPAAGQVLGADLAVNDATEAGLLSADWASLTAFAQPAHWNELELRTTAGPDPDPDPDPDPTGDATMSGGCGCGVAAPGRPLTFFCLLLVASAFLAARRRR